MLEFKIIQELEPNEELLENIKPNNYAYQNLLDQLQNPGQTYSSYQQPYAQPSGNPGRFCLTFWMYLLMCNICSWCCCGGRGGMFCC